MLHNHCVVWTVFRSSLATNRRKCKALTILQNHCKPSPARYQNAPFIHRITKPFRKHTSLAVDSESRSGGVQSQKNSAGLTIQKPAIYIFRKVKKTHLRKMIRARCTLLQGKVLLNDMHPKLIQHLNQLNQRQANQGVRIIPL